LRDYKAGQVEQERIALQTADILAGTTPPRDAEDAFRKWFRMLGGEMKGKVRTWLRQLDPIALADDLDARAVLTRDDLARLN
jgi:hypothetical protein